MSLGTGLLAAVLAAPDDEAARLVYADHLIERGDPRGEFIHIQTALGRTLHGATGFALRREENAKDPPTREALEKREKQLLKRHQKEWLLPIRPYIRTWSFKDGFVHGVEADGTKFIDGAAIIFATEPLFHADLTGLKPPTLEALAKTAPIAGLRSLTLAQQRIGPKTAKVFHSPYLTGLQALDIWGNPLGDEGVRILAESEHLGALRRLKISHSGMRVEGVRALSEARFFAGLEVLELGVGYDPDGSRALGPEAAVHLARGESLRLLDLNGARIGDAGIMAIAASTSLGNLETLHLFGNEITEVGALALARSTSLPKLGTVRGLVGYSGSFPEESDAARALAERFGAGLV